MRSAQPLLAIRAFKGRTAQAPATSEVVDMLRVLAPVIRLFYERACSIQRLLDSEQRYASTLALAAIDIAHVDYSGRFLDANPQLCRMLGTTTQSLRD
jgi:PAS domain-containing protein